MDLVTIANLKATAGEYNQFKPSRLQPDIAVVLPSAPMATIRDWGEHHCNLLSLFFALSAYGTVKIPYSEFFRKILNAKYCDNGGFLRVTKDKVAKLFGYTQNLDYLMEWENVEDPSKLDANYFYQLKIKNTSHYMISWVDDGKLLIADTHDRGIGVPAIGASRIIPENFVWLLKIDR